MCCTAKKRLTRLWACSPVATPILRGLRAFRMDACPTASSGAVGSSMNQGFKGSSFFMYSTAWGTSQTSDRKNVLVYFVVVGYVTHLRHSRFASTINTQPVGPAFLFAIEAGSIGFRSLGMLAGSSMIDLISRPRRRSSSGSAPTLS